MSEKESGLGPEFGISGPTLNGIIGAVPIPDSSSVQAYLRDSSYHNLWTLTEFGEQAAAYLEAEDPELLVSLNQDLAQIDLSEVLPVIHGIPDTQSGPFLIGATARLHIREQRLAVRRFFEGADSDQFMSVIDDAPHWYSEQFGNGIQPDALESKRGFGIVLSDKLIELQDETDDPTAKERLTQAYVGGLRKALGSYGPGEVKRAAADLLVEKIPEQPELAEVFVGLVEEGDPAVVSFLARNVTDGVQETDGAAKALVDVVTQLQQPGDLPTSVTGLKTIELDRSGMQIVGTWLKKVGPASEDRTWRTADVIKAANVMLRLDESEGWESQVANLPIAFAAIMETLQDRGKNIGNALGALDALKAIAWLELAIEPTLQVVPARRGGVIYELKRKHGTVAVMRPKTQRPRLHR